MQNDASTQFLAVYAQLHDFVAAKPPEPFLQAAAQAMNVLAPLAASIYVNASRLTAASGIPEAKVQGILGHEKTKVRNGPAPVPPRNGV